MKAREGEEAMNAAGEVAGAVAVEWRDVEWEMASECDGQPFLLRQTQLQTRQWWELTRRMI